MKASIVTLNWHHWHDLTRPFIQSLIDWTDPALLADVVIVDQESRDDEVAAMLGFPWGRAKVQPYIMRMSGNVGFPAGCNAGAAVATGDVIIQMNNDIIVRGPWLEPVLSELDRRPRAVVGASLVTNGGWNEFDAGGRHITIPYLEGWLLAARREVWDEIGPFNEAYGKGGFEDVEWCWRAGQMGCQLAPLVLPLVHLRGRTVDDGRLDQPSITAENRKKFIKALEDDAYERERETDAWLAAEMGYDAE